MMIYLILNLRDVIPPGYEKMTVLNIKLLIFLLSVLYVRGYCIGVKITTELML